MQGVLLAAMVSTRRASIQCLFGLVGHPGYMLLLMHDGWLIGIDSSITSLDYVRVKTDLLTA